MARNPAAQTAFSPMVIAALDKGEAPGRRLVFTYVRKDFIDGLNSYGAGPLYRGFLQHQLI